jgi:hypothetical protein
MVGERCFLNLRRGTYSYEISDQMHGGFGQGDLAECKLLPRARPRRIAAWEG